MITPAATADTIRVAAAAKINLYLHVVGRRPNGYHELDSLVMFASVGDEIIVRPAADPDCKTPTLTLEGPFASALAGEPPDSNLVVRAALALADSLNRPAAVELTVVKNLPVASGIGGGSADAAACLRGLMRLWQTEPEPERLLELAAGLGADIPVCLARRASYFGGIGELLAPAPTLPTVDAVLVNPGIALPTPAVFRARRGPFSPAARFTEAPADAEALAAVLGERNNDLTAPALAVEPRIGGVLGAIAVTSNCLMARLSGSGATCFGLYPDPAAADAAAGRLIRNHPDWWVKPCRLLADAAG